MACECNHQFWFIKYRWRRHSTDNWNHVNTLIGEHPLHWFHSARKNAEEEYILDWFHPINAFFFNTYKEELD